MSMPLLANRTFTPSCPISSRTCSHIVFMKSSSNILRRKRATMQIPVLFLVRHDEGLGYDGPVAVRGARKDEVKFFTGQRVVRLEEFLEHVEMEHEESAGDRLLRRLRGPL